MSYWMLQEDLIYSLLGVDAGGSEYVELPWEVPEQYRDDPELKQLFYDTMSEYFGQMDEAAERVLDDARHAAKQTIDAYIRRWNEDPRDAEYELWYSNMADDFASEELFGLRGGDPESYEIHHTYMPAMFEWLEIEEDPDFFDAVVEEVGAAGNEAWEGWVQHVQQEAYDAAKKTVLEAIPGGQQNLDLDEY